MKFELPEEIDYDAMPSNVLSELVLERLLNLKGVNEKRVSICVHEFDRSITFGNLYSALLYLGYWNEDSKEMDNGVYSTLSEFEQHEESFITSELFTQVTLSLTEDSHIRFEPIKPAIWLWRSDQRKPESKLEVEELGPYILNLMTTIADLQKSTLRLDQLVKDMEYVDAMFETHLLNSVSDRFKELLELVSTSLTKEFRSRKE